jgi:IclR family acetate operon transcriptional repressor
MEQSDLAGPKQVRVLQKTLDILEILKKERNGIGLADLARSAGIPKATVYRIVATLEIHGYLRRSTNATYQISDKFFSLQRDLSPEQNLLRVAPPIMERVAAQCRETVSLATLDGGEVVVIATVESPQSVRMASKVGNRRHVHTTGLGKILLASMPDKAIRRLVQLKGLPRLTANSLTTHAALLAEIHKVRKQGYAVDNQENELEGRCIAMQIPGVVGLNAALSISGPVFRMDMRRLRGLTPLLRDGCEQIAKALMS